MSLVQPQYSIIIYYCFYIISFIPFSAYINYKYVVYSIEISGFLISSFVLLYSPNTTLSWLIYELIKAFGNKKLKKFSLVYGNNIILSSIFVFFLMINIYFLIPAAISQIFNLTSELAIPTGTPTNEVKSEIDIHPLIAETKQKMIRVIQSPRHFFMIFTH